MSPQAPTTSPNKNLDPDLDFSVSLGPNHTRTPNMSSLSKLKSRMRNRIHTMEVLLATMTTPVQSLNQELERDEHIKRINDMTLEANTGLLDI